MGKNFLGLGGGRSLQSVDCGPLGGRVAGRVQSGDASHKMAVSTGRRGNLGNLGLAHVSTR